MSTATLVWSAVSRMKPWPTARPCAKSGRVRTRRRCKSPLRDPELTLNAQKCDSEFQAHFYSSSFDIPPNHSVSARGLHLTDLHMQSSEMAPRGTNNSPSGEERMQHLRGRTEDLLPGVGNWRFIPRPWRRKWGRGIDTSAYQSYAHHLLS